MIAPCECSNGCQSQVSGNFFPCFSSTSLNQSINRLINCMMILGCIIVLQHRARLPWLSVNSLWTIPLVESLLRSEERSIRSRINRRNRWKTAMPATYKRLTVRKRCLSCLFFVLVVKCFCYSSLGNNQRCILCGTDGNEQQHSDSRKTLRRKFYRYISAIPMVA